MATNNTRKLKTLWEQHQPGTVVLASWLEKIGISRDLQQHYRKSGWLETVGTGAFKKPGDSVGWPGALYAMQTQGQLLIHAGALTALARHGLAHYVRTANEKVFLFSPPTTNLPAWFKNHQWENPIQQVKTSFLSETAGLCEYEEKSFRIRIATPERAMLECLYLTPASLEIAECYQIMEGLANLRPKLVQLLLEQCSSIKVKRLFLYMADKAQHAWLPWIDQTRINLGSGDRSLVSGGAYIANYRISVPKELVIG